MSFLLCQSPVQEGHNLSPGADIVRGEGGGGGAAGHALVYRPLDRLGVVHSGGNIGKAGVGRLLGHFAVVVDGGLC